MPPMSMPVSIPTTPPSSIYADARFPDPDDIWKGNLRKRIEHDLLHLVEGVQILRDTTLSTHLSENDRSRVQRDYEGSMNDIRPLAEEEFTRQSYSETSEHKWILDVVNSILLDVARQHPWILDNIREADEQRTPFVPPNASQNDEGIFSTNPQQLVVSGQGSDGRSEDGYRSARAAHEGGEPDGSKGSVEAGGDTKPRQPYSNVSLTQPLHSKSQLSRENSLLYRRHTSTSQLLEDNDDEERDDSQPYSPGQVPRSPSPGSQAPVRWSIPIAPEHSGISCAFADKNGENYSTNPVSFSRLGSVNSTGSPISSAGLRHAGSLNPNQYRGSSFAHSDTEHLPVHNHYPIVSNIALYSRRDSVPLPSPHDARQYMLEAERIVVGARHTEASAKICEAAVQKKKVAEAKRNEAEAKKRRETEVHRKVEEARRRELEARQKEEFAKRNEEAARKREEEARRKEEDARRREDDTRRRLEDARQREMLARQREEEARRLEEEVRKEEEARRKEDAARRRKEKDELKTVAKEEERKPRPAQEKATPHALGSSRHEHEVASEADDTVRLEATKADAANRSAEVESAAPQHKNQSNAQDWAQAKWQRDRALEEQCRKQLEEQNRLKEQRYLEEKRREEERYQREREEQVRLDEELSRREQARLDHEAFVEQEWKREEKERETNRLRKDQPRLAEEERYRILKEQHRKPEVRERSHQRDQAPQQQQWQQKEILGQHVNDEQMEFRRKVAEHYRRTSERRNNKGAAFGTSVPHRPAGPTSVNRAGAFSKPNPTLPNTTVSKSEEEEWVKVGGNRVDPSGTKKGVSLAGSKLEEEEWARRTEERARQQQEQFERERLERLESERQAKNLNAKFVPKKGSTDGARATTGRGGNTRTAANLGGIIPRGLFQSFRR